MNGAPVDDPTRTDPQELLRRYRVPIALVVLVGGAVVLALFQPWKAFVDDVVSEDFPTISPAVQSEDDANAVDDSEMQEDETVAESMDEMDDMASTTPTASTEPVLLSEGSFISRSHGTSGVVKIFELADGSRVLRIEDLKTDNGPDLFVYLDTDGADAGSGEYDDGVSLGRLKGNIGDQNYEIPADLDLTGLDTVIIWCDRFSVAFGAADLVAA